MISRIAKAARAILVLGGISSILPALGAQSTDFIDMRSLGERGATLVLAGWGDVEAVAGLGDVNGDGFDDFGFIAYDPTASRGTVPVTILFGRPGLTGVNPLTLGEEFPGSLELRGRDPSYGFYVDDLVRAGDVNGDGRADLFLGVRYDRNNPASARGTGTGYVLFGQGGLGGIHATEEIGDTLPGVVFVCTEPIYQDVAASLVSIGDWNGDGDWDLAVGAPQSDPEGRVDAGAVFIVLGGSRLSGTVDLAETGRSIPGLVIHGVEERLADGNLRSAWLGTIIRPAGDFNGDGLDDVLLGAPNLFPDRAFLILGRREPPPLLDLARPEDRSGILEISSIPIFAQRGQLASAGDIDGDGHGDILLGRTTHGDASRVFILHGRSDVPAFLDLQEIPPGLVTAILPFNAAGPRGFEHFGYAVAAPGDINGDGVPEVLIGASGAYREGLPGVGEAYLLHGRRDFGPEVSLRNGFDGIRMAGEGSADKLGKLASGAGDFNGDGNSDLVIAAERDDGDSRLYIIYGSGSSAPPFLVHEAVPSFGSIRGGTEVTIRGSGFAGAAEVFFGTDASPSVSVVSPVEIRALSPSRASPGTVDVSVVAGGMTRMLPGAFEYTARLPEVDLHSLGSRGLHLHLGGRKDVEHAESMDFLDWTGDGVDDLALASRTVRSGADPGFSQVTIVEGGAGIGGSRPLLEPAGGMVIVTSPEGETVSAARRLGDVDGDGIEDLGLGRGLGHGYILFGRRNPGRELRIADEVLAGRAVELHLPFEDRASLTFAPAGDLTGDGIDDFLVAWHGPDLPAQPIIEAGAVVLVGGRREWPDTFGLDDPAFSLSVLTGASPEERLGKDIRDVGDTNGDGRRDLLVMAANPGGSLVPADYRLRAYLLFPSGDVPLPLEGSIERFVVDGGGVAIGLKSHPGAKDFSMSAIGDVDGDGLGDFAFASPLGGDATSGSAFVVRGRPEFPRVLLIEEDPPAPDGVVRIFGARANANIVNPSPAGDWNLDGLPDFALGSAQDFHTEPPLPGNVFVVFGGPALPERIDLARLGGRGLSFPGTQIAFLTPRCPHAGDLNADGAADLVVREESEIDLANPEGNLQGPPGSVHVLFGPVKNRSFIRGDANADETVNIVDPIHILGHLFLGREAPACEDAADSDDGGTIEITDAVRILNHLFLGTATLPAPYPDPGPDPTADVLGCLGF